MSLHKVVTLCVYAQQGYAFGRVGLCIYINIYANRHDVCVCVCVSKKLAV